MKLSVNQLRNLISEVMDQERLVETPMGSKHMEAAVSNLVDEIMDYIDDSLESDPNPRSVERIRQNVYDKLLDIIPDMARDAAAELADEETDDDGEFPDADVGPGQEGWRRDNSGPWQRAK
jgi:hypothetical protein